MTLTRCLYTQDEDFGDEDDDDEDNNHEDAKAMFMIIERYKLHHEGLKIQINMNMMTMWEQDNILCNNDDAADEVAPSA